MRQFRLSLHLATKYSIVVISSAIFFAMLIVDPLAGHSQLLLALLYLLSFALIGAALGSLGCLPWCYANQGPQLTLEIIVDCWLGSAVSAGLASALYAVAGFMLCVLADMLMIIFDPNGLLPDSILKPPYSAVISLFAGWGTGYMGTKHKSLYVARRVQQWKTRRVWRVRNLR